MRKCIPLITCPKRDPRHYRFQIPNMVWECKLRPAEYVIFSYLCYHRTAGSVTPKVIAADTHMVESTVKKYLSALLDKGLVDEDSTPSIKCETGKFFTLPKEIFLLNLPPSAFVVYAYLLLVEDRKAHTCHPSYNTIAAATGLSKNTVMKCVCTLLDVGLITMEHSCYFDQHGMKWKGNNLYTIQPTQRAIEEFHQRQLRQSELDAERRRTRKRLEQFARDHPGMAQDREALRRPL